MVRGLLNIPAGGKTNTIRPRLAALFGGWKPKSQWKCHVHRSTAFSLSWISCLRITIKVLSGSKLSVFSFPLLFLTPSLYIWEHFLIHSNIRQQVWFPHMIPLPPTAAQIPSPHYQYPPAEWDLVTVDEPELMHHNPPKSMVCIRVHFYCCTFYGLWKR